MKNLISSTIEKIKKEHIVPESRFQYLIKKYGMWVLFGLIILLGSASLSTAYHLFTGLDWDVYQFMHQNVFLSFISIFPFFWVILIGIFLLVAFFEIRKTETGYRFSWLKIFLITLGSFLLIALGMSIFGIGGRVNNMMNEVPYYSQHMVTTMEKQWMRPSSGLLAGTIKSVSDQELSLEDLDGKKWKIEINKETLIKPSANVSLGQKIKIIGKIKEAGKFVATEIRPWVGKGMGSGGHGRGMMNRNNF